MFMQATLIDWFSGGPDGYMTLTHCLRGDTFWIVVTVLLDIAVALGYLFIAYHWWENEKKLPASAAKAALGNMKRIFVLCGTCSYLFIPIKLFWPAWRLYDLFLMALVFYTWRYALNARQLRVVYHELGRSKQLAFELEESRAESRRKSEFLNAISHDLRTPLNGLMLQAELAELSASTNDPESLREALREIKLSARSTADLLGSLLELARLDWSDDPSRETVFRLDELLNHLLNAEKPAAHRKGLTLGCRCPSGLSLRTDRLKLERILQNLVTNAVKFTQAGRVDLNATPTGRDLVIEAVDTGVGIPAEQQASIFEDFFQVENRERNSAKGFGLGLAIARRLARQLRGDLAVTSELGRGSRFTVTLPGVVEGEAEARSSGESTPSSRSNHHPAALGR